MADNTMEIILQAVDNATAEIKRVQETLKDVGKKGQQSSKQLDNGFREAGKAIKDFRRDMFAITIVVASMIKLTTEWGKHNQETHQALTSLKSSVSGLASGLGSLLAPAIIGLAEAFRKVEPASKKFFGNLQEGFAKMGEWFTYHFQYWMAYNEGLKTASTRAEAVANAHNVAAAATKEFGEEFRLAYKEDNLGKVNELEESLRKMKESLAAWENPNTAGKTMMMTQELFLTQQMTEAYNSFYTQTAMLDENSTTTWIRNMQARTDAAKFMVANINTAMQNMVSITIAGSNAFFNSFSTTMTKLIMEGGKFKDAMTAIFKDFATAVIAEITKIIAKLLAMKAIMFLLGMITGGGSVAAESAGGGGVSGMGLDFASGFGGMHKGGLIRAHSGLAVDEVPIIAQTGEGVLSRRGMAALGGAGMLNRLNGGGGVGGHQIHIEINYPTIRSNEDIDTLTEEISNRLAREADRI
jgi:hypothetical protein